MPQVCKICGHSKRRAIDAGLRRNETYRALAARFAVTKDGLARHFHNHLRTATKTAEIGQKENPPSPAAHKTAATGNYRALESGAATKKLAAPTAVVAEPETTPVTTPPLQVDQDILKLCLEYGELSREVIHAAFRQVYPVMVINLALVRGTIRGTLAVRVIGPTKFYRLKEPVRGQYK